MNPKLKEAIAIFKELGWEKATPENILDLPTGTPEQRKTALEGLKSGQLGDFIEESRTYRWKTHFGVNQEVLTLFAIRVGATASRAKTLLSSSWDRNFGDAKIKVIASRGDKFASTLVDSWYGNNTEGTFRDTPVRLVLALDLDIPQKIGYFTDWAMLAFEALSLTPNRWIDPDGKWLTPATIEARFAEHIRSGLVVNTPLTGNFGEVAIYGIKRGLLDRDEMIPHIFAALDSAIRPVDRKVLLEILDQLNITDEEIASRVQALIPILATSDTTVINRLAPPLIAHVSDELLTEVMLSAFSATTKKTRLLVLKSAQGRKRPPNAEEIAPWLSMLAADKDKSIVTAATKLMQAWDIENEAAIADEETTIQGLWQDTPPLWQVPPFETGGITQDNLTDCLAVIYERKDQATTYDIAVERLLTVAVALAYKNPEDVRIALAGLKTSEWWGSPLLHYLNSWSKGENLLKPGWSSRQPLIYRDRFVAMNLGKLPCLLSAPGKVDLSITVPDLAERLAIYNKLGVAALDSDLFIALTRLDAETKTPEAIKLLESIKVEVIKPTGGLMRRVMIPVNACEMALKYLNDPTAESKPAAQNPGGTGGKIPKSLAIFNCHLPDYGVYSMFPFWGDAAFRCVGWNEGTQHTTGHILRQVARRRDPLPPGAAINMLGAQRSASPQAQADVAIAVTEAWERGLLRPGIADVSLLDWKEKGPPSNISALAVALEGLAREGMLSVVWPILDNLIEVSLKQPRMLSGTAELAELVAEFLPEVLHAVQEGKTGDYTLNLPGICELATRSGASKAVTAAKKAVAQLPERHGVNSGSTKNVATKPAPEMKIPFDQIWQRPDTESAITEDGAKLEITFQDKAKSFRFTLTLPGAEPKVLNITNIWPYDLENSGILTANISDLNASVRSYQPAVFLQWDSQLKALVAHDNRDDNKKSRKASKPELPISIITMILATTAQSKNSYTYYYSMELVNKLAKKEGLRNKDGQLNPHIVKRAMEIILQSPDVSPAKLVRSIENNLHLLPVLWPMLTESVRFAGAKVAAGEKAPLWINRVLDVCYMYAPYLAEAAKRGYIPAEDAKWPGLSDIANAKVKSTAVAKAATLIELLT